MALALWRRAKSLDPSLKEAQRAIAFALEQMPHISQNQGGFLTGSFKKFIGWASLTDLLLLGAISLLTSGSLLLKYFGQRKRALSMEAPLPPYPLLAGSLSIFMPPIYGPQSL